MAYRDGDGAVIDRTGRHDWAAPAAAPSIIPALPRDDSDEWAACPGPQQPKLTRCPEIDCVRGLLPPIIVSLAERRAAEVGVGADRVLTSWGVISEETYVTALAASLDIEFEPLAGIPRQRCPLPDNQLTEAATNGMLPLADNDGVRIVVAPRLVDSRRLVMVARSGTELARRIRLTSTARLAEFATLHGASDIESRAVEELRARHPEMSAGTGRPHLAALGLAATAATVAAVADPDTTLRATELALGFIFLAWTGLRLLGLLTEPFLRRRRHTISDDQLPIYTVIVALYHEAAGVADLVAALRQLNYPGIMAQTPQDLNPCRP